MEGIYFWLCCLNLHRIRITEKMKTILAIPYHEKPGADPGFPVGRGANPPGGGTNL